MVVRRGRDAAFTSSRARRLGLRVLCMKKNNDRSQLARGYDSVDSAVEGRKLNS